MNKNKLLNSKIYTALIGVLALWLTLSSVNLNSERNAIDREMKNIETKIQEIRNDTDYLNKFLAYFQTPTFLEKEARLKLNYKDQGEEVVFIYKDKNVKKESDPINFEELLSKMPNYKKWFWYVLGY